MGCQTKVIWCNFGKWFYIGVSFDCFDMRGDDLLFLYGGRLFLNNVDDSVIRGLQIVKLVFRKDHFEGFGPVLMFGSASHKSKRLYLNKMAKDKNKIFDNIISNIWFDW